MRDKSLSETSKESERFLSAKAAAEYLGVHLQTVYKWKRDGLIPFTVLPGGRSVRFDKVALDKLLKDGSSSPVPVPVDISTIDSLSGYDKRFLKEVKVSGVTTRYTYKGIGSITERKTKSGGKTFAIHFQYKGTRVREVIKGAQTRADAVKVLNDRIRDAFDREHGIKRDVPELTFAEMADKYMEKYSKQDKRSWKSDESYLKTLCTSFGQLRLSEIGPEKIEDYKLARLKVGLKGISINRHLACLKTLFSKANDWGYCSFNPVKKVKMFSEAGTAKQRILTPVEETKLLEACPDYLRNIVFMDLHSGLRRGEILPLEWKDVHFDEALIHVALPKEGESKEVPINDEVMVVLRSLRAKAETAYVFPNPKTERPYVDGKRAFKKACAAAGIVGLRFHDFRHSFITREMQAGVQSRIIMSITGHKSEKTFGRYAHPQQEDRLRAVQLLCKKPPQSENLCQTSGKPESVEPVPVPVSETELAS